MTHSLSLAIPRARSQAVLGSFCSGVLLYGSPFLLPYVTGESTRGTGTPKSGVFLTGVPSTVETQVTNEPPAGLKAGILRSYTVIVDQERLERVETAQWRQLLFALCFLHSVVSRASVVTVPLQNKGR